METGSTVAAVFLLVGALGVVVLLLSLFAGELGEFGHADAAGPFSVLRLSDAERAGDGVTHVPVASDGDG
jgi:hypothetical protein